MGAKKKMRKYTICNELAVNQLDYRYSEIEGYPYYITELSE